MLMTDKYTLSNYCNTVNQRHPNANDPNRTFRIIHTLVGRRGIGRYGGRGIGRGGLGGKGCGSGNHNACLKDE